MDDVDSQFSVSVLLYPYQPLCSSRPTLTNVTLCHVRMSEHVWMVSTALCVNVQLDSRALCVRYVVTVEAVEARAREEEFILACTDQVSTRKFIPSMDVLVVHDKLCSGSIAGV